MTLQKALQSMHEKTRNKRNRGNNTNKTNLHQGQIQL